jgi:hypothetical protein
MNKTKLSSILLIAVIISGIAVAGVIADTIYSLSFHQNPSVTSTPIFTTTPSITAGSDQTALWTWNPVTMAFTASLNITNTGNIAFTPVIVSNNAPSGYAFTTSALTSIAIGGSLPVTMTLTYQGTPPAPAGNVGDFTVAISTS